MASNQSTDGDSRTAIVECDVCGESINRNATDRYVIGTDAFWHCECLSIKGVDE